MKLVKEKITNSKGVQNAVKIGTKPKSWKDKLLPIEFEPILLDCQDYVYN